MDETIAREVFEAALASHAPGFGTFFLARLLELDISYDEAGSHIAFPVRDHFLNPGGTMHGGIIATILDVSMGHLVNHTLGVGGATVQMNVNYLSAMTAPSGTCEGRFLRRGRSLCSLESRMYDAKGTLAAAATATWKPRNPPPLSSRSA